MEERGTGKKVEYLLFIERLLAGSSVKQFSRSVFIIRNRVNRVKRHFYLKKKIKKGRKSYVFHLTRTNQKLRFYDKYLLLNGNS